MLAKYLAQKKRYFTEWICVISLFLIQHYTFFLCGSTLVTAVLEFLNPHIWYYWLNQPVVLLLPFNLSFGHVEKIDKMRTYKNVVC